MSDCQPAILGSVVGPSNGICLTMHCSLQIGFRSVEVVTDKLVGAVTGFDRPIEVYHK